MGVAWSLAVLLLPIRWPPAMPPGPGSIVVSVVFVDLVVGGGIPRIFLDRPGFVWVFLNTVSLVEPWSLGALPLP